MARNMLLVIGNKNYSSWSLLFGQFTAADAVLALPALREWIADAEREAKSIPQFGCMAECGCEGAAARPFRR